MVTIGESNDSGQRRELLDLFGNPDPGSVTTVSVADTVAALEGIYDLSGIDSAFSSTALTCAPAGTGLDVSTANIEVVSPALYAVALVTAGVGDATLIVGAPASAPAQGLTGLAGVFRAWDTAPCSSAATNPTRQRLALEQLALIVRAGTATGDIDLVTDLVLRTQRAVVSEGLAEPVAIEAALAAEESSSAVAIPEPERGQVVTFLTRLAAAKLDWGAYADGWTITPRADGSGLSMVGAGAAANGIWAIATAQAAADAAATAEAAADARATAAVAADPTSPAQAVPAVPSVAPPATPAPTAAPAAITVVGRLEAIGGGRLVVEHDGAGPTMSYAVDPTAGIARDGETVTIDRLRRGDRIALEIAAGSSAATRVTAASPPSRRGNGFGGFWWLLVPIGVMVPAAILAGGWWSQGAFVVRPVDSAAAGPMATGRTRSVVVMSSLRRRRSDAPISETTESTVEPWGEGGGPW